MSVSDLKITPLLIAAAYRSRCGWGSLAGNLIQDRRDDPVDPHRGIYNTVDLGLAEHVFGSQRDFVRVLARNATYHPLGKRLVLARSTEFGEIYAFHYSGERAGRHSAARALLRRRRHLRPRISRIPGRAARHRKPASRFGGTALFFNQTELRFPLIGENIGGVLFHDIGNIYLAAWAISRFASTSTACRISTTWCTPWGSACATARPVGPLRADLAYSINPPNFFGFKRHRAGTGERRA